MHILELGLDLHLGQFGPHAHGRDISFLIALPEPALVLFHYALQTLPLSHLRLGKQSNVYLCLFWLFPRLLFHVLLLHEYVSRSLDIYEEVKCTKKKSGVVLTELLRPLHSRLPPSPQHKARLKGGPQVS